jgi:hypothetical protein
MIEVKPCPRCGCPAEEVIQRWSGRDYHSVKCADIWSRDCGIWLDSRSGTPEEAAAAWNARAIDVDAMIAALRQIKRICLNAEGHTFDLILSLADKALPLVCAVEDILRPAIADQGGDVQQAPSRSDESGGAGTAIAQTPSPHPISRTT